MLHFVLTTTTMMVMSAFMNEIGRHADVYSLCTQFNFKSVVCHRDGKLLIGGGRSRYLHIWSLDTQSLLRVVELPRKVTSVHQLEFLPTSFDAGSNKVCYFRSTHLCGWYSCSIANCCSHVTFAQHTCVADILVALQTAVVCLFM